MMKNNSVLKTKSPDQEDSSLSIAYKKTNHDGPVAVETGNTSIPVINPALKRKVSKKKTETIYRQLVPDAIYQELPIIEEAIRPFIQGYRQTYLLQMISIVAWHIRKDKGISRLQMKHLKKQVPQCDKYLINLIDQGVIIRTGHPIKAEKSYEYSFAPVYQSKYVEVLLNDKKLIRRIELLRGKVEKEHRKTIWGHLKQREFLKLLTMDAECYKIIKPLEQNNVEKYNNLLASANRIDQQIHTCIRDKTSQRLHTNITNMSKELRRFLRVDGQPLVNIDIKNSQPYLSVLLLTHPEKVPSFAKDKELIKLLKEIQIPNSKDIHLYIKLVTTGELYEYLMAEFSKEGLMLERKDTKRQVLRTLYAKNRLPKNPDNRRARQIFTDRFPNVHRVFSRIRGRGKGEKFENYKRLAILLQSIESHLVLDVIMKRVYKELPGVFAMTIHDSILTVNRPKVVEMIRGIMEAELKNFVGYAPQLEIEWLGGEKL